LSKGFIYRWGMWIKDYGEHMGRIPVIRLFCRPVIALGLAIKDSVMNRPIADFSGK
jgi:hypothetical protein